MRSACEFPDNKTGTQWPDEVQKRTGVSMVKIRSKKRGNPEYRWRWRLPEDHLCTGGFLEQTQKGYRAADETDDIPQPQQPAAALGQVRDERHRSEQQHPSKHPCGANRKIDGAGESWREVSQ